MATPTRFPQGLSTFAPRSVLGTYPIGTSPRQIAITEDFIPYRATDYVVTTAVAGTVVTFPFLSGAVKLATSASATDTVYLQQNGAAFQFINGNQAWADFKVSYPLSVLNSNDTNIYLGWFDTANPSLAANAIYFFKPSGGTSVNFIIKKAGVTTTFQNVADLAKPSGLFGDAASVSGILSATVAATAFSAITVPATTQGSGYQNAPLVLSTITSGVAGNVPVFVQLGSSSFSGNPSVPTQSSALPYGNLFAPYIVAPGAVYTNAGPVTTYLEVEPIIDLMFWFDGRGKLTVGVNGRQVMAIEGTPSAQGVVGIAAGGTSNVATAGPSYFSTTQLTTLVAPFQPPIGSPINLLPQVPLNLGFGFSNTSVNIRTFYVMEYNAAIELN